MLDYSNFERTRKIHTVPRASGSALWETAGHMGQYNRIIREHLSVRDVVGANHKNKKSVRVKNQTAASSQISSHSILARTIQTSNWEAAKHSPAARRGY